jgi:hypothetical protein
MRNKWRLVRVSGIQATPLRGNESAKMAMMIMIGRVEAARSCRLGLHFQHRPARQTHYEDERKTQKWKQ